MYMYVLFSFSLLLDFFVFFCFRVIVGFKEDAAGPH